MKKYLSENPLIDERSQIRTLMETVYQFYIDGNGENAEEIAGCFDEIDRYTKTLSFLERDAICCTVAELAVLQGHAAFLDGMQAGAQLVLELLGK